MRPPTLVLVALGLIALGIGHSVHRHLEQSVPLLPGASETFWDVEARVRLEADGGPVRVRLAVPEDTPGFGLRGEHTASPGYGLQFLDEGQRRAEWTTRSADGLQVLYYRAQFRAVEGGPGGPPARRAPERPAPDESVTTWRPALQIAANEVLESAYAASVDAYSLAAALSRRLQDPNNQNARLLLSEADAPRVLVRLLAQAEVPARVVRALELEDGRRRQDLKPIVRVYGETGSRLYDPATGGRANTDRLLLWEGRGGPVLEVEGGEDSGVSFSILETRRPAATVSRDGAVNEGLFNLSIYSLPISEQTVFKSILLLPLGALVVVFFRVFVGLQTSGTFMPVLIALAFIKMSLVTGLVTFLLVIGGGLVLRQALANLNLLLVARVSVVIVCVIGLVALLSVLSFHLGFADALQMPFFPMIIIAWTIERLSILWEEEGAHEVFIQGGGSLATAIVAYLVMQQPWVQYWMFNFLGLQLVVLALIILVGSYTGYRLSEMWRFRNFWKRADA
jgi:hypothetical protein